MRPSSWSKLPPQDHFLESMADACQAVIAYKGAENMVYINVANRLSVDCDCSANPAEPEMADLGIFASLDPVAVDQACYDAVLNSPDPGKKALIERMESKPWHPHSRGRGPIGSGQPGIRDRFPGLIRPAGCCWPVLPFQAAQTGSSLP